MSIRPAVLADIPTILEIYTPYVVNTTYSFEYTAPTQAEMEKRFLQYSEKFPWFVWEENGVVVGYAYASPMAVRMAYQWSADVSIYIRDDCHGKGIGRALYEALETELQKLGYYNLIAIITEENSGSRAFHEKMEYVHTMDLPRVGYKFGRWLGVSYYCKRIADGNPEKAPAHWDSAGRKTE